MEVNINLIVAIIGGTITISSFFITRYLERKKEIELEIRNMKIPIYVEFFDFYFKVIFGNKVGKSLEQDEMAVFFREFHQKAIIWFPEDVLKIYIEWRALLVKYSEENNMLIFKELIVLNELLMKKMRQDIGHSNKGIKKGDLSSLFINDIKKIIN